MVADNRRATHADGYPTAPPFNLCVSPLRLNHSYRNGSPRAHCFRQLDGIVGFDSPPSPPVHMFELRPWDGALLCLQLVWWSRGIGTRESTSASPHKRVSASNFLRATSAPSLPQVRNAETLGHLLQTSRSSPFSTSG